MSQTVSLSDAYRKTDYQVAGHGPRNVEVLKEALRDVDGGRLGDTYGQGEIIAQFQSKMATYLGKPAAVFFPSGTMAQQIALRIWCDRRGTAKVAYHPLCHLEIHEQDGLRQLHHIAPLLLGQADRLMTMEDVRGISPDVACLLLELPQREIGGQLPEWKDLAAITAYARDHQVRLHLDGARLYESLPYYQKTAAAVADLFDSVYISFYKSIGGVAGAILAGPEDFIAEAAVWKRRHGGDLISLYPYILAADYYFDRRIAKMTQYYDDARELAAWFNLGDRVSTNPQTPVTNMFHVHIGLPASQVEVALKNTYLKTGVGVTANVRDRGENQCSFEISVGDQYAMIPPDRLKHTFDVFHAELAHVAPSEMA